MSTSYSPQVETVNAQVLAIGGPLQGRSFPITEKGLAIGREPSNDISLAADVSVSRQHCRNDKEGQEHRIIDLESRNGTFVNGARVKERLLHNGDQIKIGESVLSLQLSGPEAYAPFSVALE